MPSLADLQFQGAISDQAAANSKATAHLNNYQTAAKEASDHYLQGDHEAAIATMMKVDPDLTKNLLGQLGGQFNPGVQGKVAGAKADAELPSAIALENAKSANKVKENQTKENKPVIRRDDFSPTGFSSIQGGKKVFVGQGGEVVGTADSSDQPKKSTKLLPNQEIGLNGETITLSPYQNKVIEKTRKEFDDQTKELVKAIESGHQSLIMIDKNVPGSEALEKIRVLRSVAQSRINTQEFQQYGKDMGLFNEAENELSKAGGKGMSPKVQTFMRQVAQTALDTAGKEYDQKLKNVTERTSEVDPLVLKKKLVGSGPTVYQDILKKVSGLPPELQSVYNNAHDALSSGDATTAAKAKAAIKIFADKYGIK